MAYYEDLSDYEYYHKSFYRPVTKNVGWLGLEHEFPTEVPTETFLDKLWDFCLVSVAQMRGRHVCELCAGGNSYCYERNGGIINIGTAEIRAFSKTEIIYAAPNLIYHYVKIHHYRPPDDFLLSILNGPAPPSQVYFDRLKEVNLDWNKTWGHHLSL